MRALLSSLTLALALLACAPKTEAPAPIPESRETYVILPANFIIDLAAGAKARLNPAFQEFIIYPSVAEASEALERIPGNKDDWKIYLLDGTFAELAEPTAEGYRLALPARAIDWIEPTN
ncbi:MAG: hypothetical protein HDQ93_03315 [Desulfovibrio sp.]|nr:hypothetical protein [Desulfovibrio sp.]